MTTYNVIDDAIRMYRPAHLSKAVTDITDLEIIQYLVNMSQDMTVNEDKRVTASEQVTTMIFRRTPPGHLPIFLMQEEVLALIEICTVNLVQTSNDEHLKARLRAIRTAAALVTVNVAPKVLRWEDKLCMSFLDVPNVGRYLVRRSGARSRHWVAFLNGKSTVFAGNTRADVIRAIEKELSK